MRQAAAQLVTGEEVLAGSLGNLLLYESEELRRLWMNLHLAP